MASPKSRKNSERASPQEKVVINTLYGISGWFNDNYV